MIMKKSEDDVFLHMYMNSEGKDRNILDEIFC